MEFLCMAAWCWYVPVSVTHSNYTNHGTLWQKYGEVPSEQAPVLLGCGRGCSSEARPAH